MEGVLVGKGSRTPLEQCQVTLEQGSEPQMVTQGTEMSWLLIQWWLLPYATGLGSTYSDPKKGAKKTFKGLFGWKCDSAIF